MVNLSSFNCSTDRWRQLSRQSYAKSSRANRIQPSRKVRSRGQAALSPPNAPTASHRLVLKWNFTYFSSLTRPHTHIGIYLANRRQMGICQWHGDCPWPHWHVIGQNYEFAFEFACEQSIDGSEAEEREGKDGREVWHWSVGWGNTRSFHIRRHSQTNSVDQAAKLWFTTPISYRQNRHTHKWVWSMTQLQMNAGI